MDGQLESNGEHVEAEHSHPGCAISLLQLGVSWQVTAEKKVRFGICSPQQQHRGSELRGK